MTVIWGAYDKPISASLLFGLPLHDWAAGFLNLSQSSQQNEARRGILVPRFAELPGIYH
jgi:hypothetical protein